MINADYHCREKFYDYEYDSLNYMTVASAN